MMLAVCPNCHRRLKVNPGPADRVLTCPACNTKFQLQVTATALPVASATATPVALPIPLTPAGPQPLPVPLTPAHAVPPSEQATVMPGWSGVSPPPAPAPARRAVPVAAPLPSPKATPVRTAAPVAKPVVARRPDDDEPAPPIPKRRKDDDEDDDDRPGRRSRSSRRADDEDDDPPKKRGGMLFVLIGGACLALAVVAVAVVVFTAVKTTDDKPTAGKSLGKYGGIEIGAKGIKSVVVDFTAAEGGGYAFTMPFERDHNVGLAALPTGGSDFDPVVLDRAVAEVKQAHDQMTKSHGVSADKVFVVASSGLFVSFKDNPAARERNAAELTRRVKAATGLDLQLVSEKDEGRLSMLACVPTRDFPTTLLVDVGSGNTKGGVHTAPDTFTPLVLDAGVKSYTEKVDANADLRPAVRLSAAQLQQKLLARPLHDQTEREPGLLAPRRVYLNGGIVYAMATYTHPVERGKMRTPLKVGDIDTFRKLLARPDQEAVRREVLAAVPQTTDEGKATAKLVEEDLAKIPKIYSPRQYQNGLDILEAVSAEFDLARKEVIFFNKSHLTLIMGSIIENGEIEKKAEAEKKPAK